MKILNPNNTFFFKVSNPEEYDKLWEFVRTMSGNEGDACECCGELVLMWQYVFLIHKLKKAGLLPDNYKMVCCKCYGFLNLFDE